MTVSLVQEFLKCLVLLVILGKNVQIGVLGDVTTNYRLTCYNCYNNKYVQSQSLCPADGHVNTQLMTSHFCNDLCYTRFMGSDTSTVFRGCALGFYLPEAMRTPGCHRYNDQTWCFCDTNDCNAKPLKIENLTIHENTEDYTMSMGPRQSTFNTYVNDHIGAPMLTTQRAKYGAQPTQEAQSNNQPRGRNGQLHEYVRWGEDDVQSLEHNLKDIDDKRDRIHHIHKSWDSYLSESNQNNQYSENSAEYHDSETVEYNSEIAENDFDSKEYNSEIEATGYDAETVENDYKTIDYDSKIEEFDSEAVENNLDISKDSNEQQEVENNKMTIKGNRSPRIYRNRVQTEKPDKYDNRNETSELKTQVKSGFGRKMMLMKLTPAGQNDVTAGVKSVQNISQTLILIVQFVIGILFI